MFFLKKSSSIVFTWVSIYQNKCFPLEISVLWEARTCLSLTCSQNVETKMFLSIFFFSFSFVSSACLNVESSCLSFFLLLFTFIDFPSLSPPSVYLHMLPFICPSIYLSICQRVQGQCHSGPAGSGQTGRLQGWWPHYGGGELNWIFCPFFSCLMICLVFTVVSYSVAKYLS